MTTTKTLRSFVLMVFFCTSCGPKSPESSKAVSLALEVTDSIQVDYLGEMRLQDYDPGSDQYLLVSDLFQNYLEVGADGKVIQDKTLAEDGLDNISTAMGLSYLDGKVIVLTPDQGYVKFEDGNRMDNVKVPYPYSTFVFYPKLGFHEIDGKAIYPNLWPESMQMGFDNPEFYLQLYRRPIMQIQDLTSKDTLGIMSLPPSSPLSDGRIHGIPIPIVTQRGKDWLLGMWLEPRFYVYREEAGKFEYLKTAEFDVPNWAGYSPVEPAQAGTFFDQMQTFTAATVEDLLVMGDYVLAVYRKGVSPERYAAFDRKKEEDRIEIHKINPYYVAVFSKDYELIQADLKLPAGVHGPTVVNNNGELMASKNPSLSEVEDEGLILYKMKLVEKEE
jgi:hypothetical protein